MRGAKPLPRAAYLSVGVGEVNARRSIDLPNPPNPNRALSAFVVTAHRGQRARLRRGQLGGQGQEGRLLGGGVLGRRLLGGRVLVGRELGDASWSDAKLGLGLLGRHPPRRPPGPT